MKMVCQETGMSYETLKFYCNQGLIPNVKRNANNHRIFDENDLAWIKDLECLKKCGMTIAEMKNYLTLCLQGRDSIEQRQIILAQKREQLLKNIKVLEASINYIDRKNSFYNQVLTNAIPYHSHLVKNEH